MRLPSLDFESSASTNFTTPAHKKRKNGAEGDRTPDLLHAMQALSQLSYGPERGYKILDNISSSFGLVNLFEWTNID